MRLATTFFLALLCVRGDSLNDILSRMDIDAAKFHGVTAQLTRIDYVASIKDRSEEKASLTLMKKNKNVTALLDFTSPDVRDLLFRDGQVNEYLPKLNLVREYDLGKYSSVVNQFVMLGFGASGKDLKKSYDIQFRGTEVLKIADKDVPVTKLELTPRAADALQYMKRIEFWIPDGASYAVQLKIYQPSGDTNTAIYSSVQVNPPGLTTVELKTPKNAAHEKVNK